MTSKELREKLAEVPQVIREWFGSEEVVAHIRSLSNELGTPREKRGAIPRLLLRLEVGDLEPQFFSGELAQELGLTKERALAVASEIRKTILHPKKEALSDYGIDQFLLEEFNLPIPRMRRETVTPVAAPSSAPTFGSSTAILHPPSVPQEPSPPPSPTTTKSTVTPFVLHEEKPLTSEAKKEPMKGFSLPFGLFKPKAPESTISRASVEAPKQVHYSEYRSGGAPGGGGEFINLETFGKTSVAPKSVTPPTPPPPSSSPATPLTIKKPDSAGLAKAPESGTGTPKIEKNTVDLR